MLFPHLSFLSAQQHSVFCLINENDNDGRDTVLRLIVIAIMILNIFFVFFTAGF